EETRPQDHKTTRPQDHKTTRPQDHKTTRPQDYGQQEDRTKRCAAVKAAELQRIRSGVCEFTTRFGNRAAKFARGFNPFLDDLFCVFYGFRITLAVGHAAWELWHFDNKAVVVFAPINDQFVTHSYSMLILYFKSNSRTCFT